MAVVGINILSFLVCWDVALGTTSYFSRGGYVSGSEPFGAWSGSALVA